jgi:hypothetical protein
MGAYPCLSTARYLFTLAHIKCSRVNDLHFEIGSPLLSQVFVSGYPRLVRLLRDFFGKLGTPWVSNSAETDSVDLRCVLLAIANHILILAAWGELL